MTELPTNEYAAIPPYLMEALQRYIAHGYAPGNFLLAVLRNDLKAAVAHADLANQAILPVYVRFLYNRAPWACWGSPAHVTAWVEARQAERTPVTQEEN